MTRQPNPNPPKARATQALVTLEERALSRIQGGLFYQTAAHGDGTQPAGIYL